MTAGNIDQEWAELTRNALLREAYSALSDHDLDEALRAGIVLPKDKVRIICIVDIAVANWLAQREDQENDINFALRIFMEHRSKGTAPIKPLPMDRIPLNNRTIRDTIHNFCLLYENDWFIDELEKQAHNIITLDLSIVDWYQRNYGPRYEFQIAEVLRSFMESQTQA